VTIFLSAFLLFQVQPMIGKMILPWFGGSAAVWTTCVLFFQMLLLLGYGYSHLMPRLLSPRAHGTLHIMLLVASLLCLPLAPGDAWRPVGHENPTLQILALLTATLGLPYFVLSTTGPLVQAWFARERPEAVPYRLFALSNLGSLLALLAYPLLIEPTLSTRSQSWLWSLLFVLFALACGGLSWRGRAAPAVAPGGLAPLAAPALARQIAWVALAACPSIMLLADTSFLSENVAPIPLLWVLPLALYLLSFIFCFERQGWYRRALFLPLLVAGLGALAWLPTLGMNALPVLLTMAIHLVAFFVICMVCHGELAALRPPARQLTAYYLMISVGGACGGLFVGLVAPYCFQSNYEYSVGLVVTALVVSAVVLRRHTPARRRGWVLAATTAMTLAIACVRVDDHYDDSRDAKLLVRDFYGSQGVFDVGSGVDAHRTLMHGQIIHGKQYLSAERSAWPTTYYGTVSGVGRALRAKGHAGPLHVGVVGLGAGTLAAYGRAGDRIRFYEIDPLVEHLARTQFTFLSGTPADCQVVLGDARISLERETSQQFDVLAIDAFSGDSVPVHLLTREAFASYFRHLKGDGVLAIHVTNRFLELAPVVRAAATAFGAQARLVDAEGDRSQERYHSRWVLVTQLPSVFDAPELAGIAQPIIANPELRAWTDDYSSIFAVLK
jgi:SAM-dependent methyltransferase